jgi:hypothetical protein
MRVMAERFIEARRLRRWLIPALLCSVGWSVEVYTLAYYKTTHLDARGAHPVLLEAFGERAPITQTFTMPTDGFDAVRVRLSSSGTIDVTFDWKLSQQWQENAFTPLFGNRQTVHMTAGQRWATVAFPAIVNSADKIYKLDLQVAASEPPTVGAPGGERRAVAIAASLDHVVHGGFLTVGDEESWGDLVFDTHAVGDTILGRFWLRTAPGLPAPLRRGAVLWAALVFYNFLLAVFVIQLWPTRSPPPASDSPAHHPRRTVPAFAVSACLVAALIAVYGERTRAARVDLIDELYGADLRSGGMTPHAAFDVREEAIGDETMPAIFAHAPSKITWTMTVPERVNLRTALAIDPGAWPVPTGDGVVFRVGVSERDQYTEIFMRHIDPAHVAQDRRWTPVDIDLARFSGRHVRLIFMTDPSLPGQPVNPGYDWAFWGAPRLVDK